MKKHFPPVRAFAVGLITAAFFVSYLSAVSQTVLNVGSGQTYTTVQAAINAASGVQVDTVNIVTSPITELGITVNKNVVIRGQGSSSTVLQAAASPNTAANRVMTVTSGHTVLITKLTIQNGKAQSGADNSNPSGLGNDGEAGGGIFNLGTLTLRDCKILNCYAGNGGRGGPGSFPPGGPLVPTGQGGLGGYGGAIYNEGIVYLYQCTLSGNHSGTGGGGGIPANGYIGGSIPGVLNGGPGIAGGNGGPGGGGSAIFSYSGSIKLIETTISGNICGSGGIGHDGSNGGDGLISTKAAIQSGGGGTGGNGGAGGLGAYGTIYNFSVIDSIVNCTFYGNLAGNGGNGGNGGFGGTGMKGADSIQSPVLGPVFYGGTGGDGGSGGQGGQGGNAGNGGAVYLAGGSSIGYICNSTFTQNISGAFAGNGGNGGDCGTFGFPGNASPAPPGVQGQPGQVGTNGSGGNGGNAGYGGGLYNTGGTASIKNTIIAGNSCTPAPGSGGSPGSQMLGNSGISGSPGSSGLGNDAYGNYTTLGHNLVGKKDNSNFVNGVNGDICGTIAVPVDAQLGPLSDNGGKTFTVPISDASPAKNAADATNAPSKDQRGRNRNGIIDIGSFEYFIGSMVMADDGNITEGSENGELIIATLTDDVFITSLTAANFTLANLPAGVTRGVVTRTSDHTATIALSGNRTTDYDTDITNVSLTINQSEVAGLTSGSYTANSGVILHANVESCTISPTGVLFEPTLNNDTINLLLVNDFFTDASLLATNFVLTNAPPGVSIGAANYVDPTHANLILSFNGTHFFSDYTNATITVNEAEINGAANLTSNTVTFFFDLTYSMDKIQSDNGLNIYPNPANDRLFVNSFSNLSGVQLNIYNASGLLVLDKNLPDLISGNEQSVDISWLPGGLYFFKIITEKQVSLFKIVVQ
jgi:hypothetical protein